MTQSLYNVITYVGKGEQAILIQLIPKFYIIVIWEGGAQWAVTQQFRRSFPILQVTKAELRVCLRTEDWALRRIYVFAEFGQTPEYTRLEADQIQTGHLLHPYLTLQSLSWDCSWSQKSQTFNFSFSLIFSRYNLSHSTKLNSTNLSEKKIIIQK